jgi:hypothetical protein
MAGELVSHNERRDARFASRVFLTWPTTYLSAHVSLGVTTRVIHIVRALRPPWPIDWD